MKLQNLSNLAKCVTNYFLKRAICKKYIWTITLPTLTTMSKEIRMATITILWTQNVVIQTPVTTHTERYSEHLKPLHVHCIEWGAVHKMTCHGRFLSEVWGLLPIIVPLSETLKLLETFHFTRQIHLKLLCLETEVISVWMYTDGKIIFVFSILVFVCFGCSAMLAQYITINAFVYAY